FDHLASLKVALGGMPGKYMATSDHPFRNETSWILHLPELVVLTCGYLRRHRYYAHWNSS
ncbi:hypothetical protein, partial [Pseudomonas aeruginosa]